MISEEVEQKGEGEDIHSPTDKNQNLWHLNANDCFKTDTH